MRLPWVYDAAFLDEDTLLSASSDHTIKLWKINNQSQISLYDVHKKRVRAVSFSPDGQMVASASDDGTVKLWSSEGELKETIEAYDSEKDDSKGNNSNPHSALQNVVSKKSKKNSLDIGSN